MLLYATIMMNKDEYAYIILYGGGRLVGYGKMSTFALRRQ